MSFISMVIFLGSINLQICSVKFAILLLLLNFIIQAFPFLDDLPCGDLEWLSKKYKSSFSLINPKLKTPVIIIAWVELESTNILSLCSIWCFDFAIVGLYIHDASKAVSLTMIVPTTSSTLKWLFLMPTIRS